MSLGKSKETERKESVGIKDLCQHRFEIYFLLLFFTCRVSIFKEEKCIKLGRLESERGGESLHAGVGGGWVEGKTVFFSNQTQNTMLPQSFKSPKSIFAPVLSSPSSLCDVPNVVTLCPACYAWGLLSPAWSYTCLSSQTSLEVLSIVVLVKKSCILSNLLQ